MIRKSDVWKSFIIVPIVLISEAGMLIKSGVVDCPVAELFLQSIFFGNPSRTDTNVVLVMFGMFEIIIFNLLFGSYIYRDLYENTVYIFVRQKNRVAWLWKRAAGLLLYTMFFHVLYTGMIFGLCLNFSKYEMDKLAIEIFFITYVMLVLYTYWITLIINLLAIRMGETFAFIITYIGTLLLSVLAITHEKIPVLKEFPVLLKFNPVAAMALHWENGVEEAALHMVYFVILIVLTLVIGSLVMQRVDIGLENKERAN